MGFEVSLNFAVPSCQLKKNKNVSGKKYHVTVESQVWLGSLRLDVNRTCVFVDPCGSRILFVQTRVLI